MDSTFRSLRGLFGLTIATAALLLALPAIAAADTFTVNDDDVPGDVGPGGTCGPRDHTTINDAVAVAGDGDVIRVCAGSYDETVETSTSITFLGAQAGVDARTRAVPDGEESLVTTDDADATFDLGGGVESGVDGFSIIGNPAGPGVSPGSGTSIVNNIISVNNGGVFGDALAGTIRRNRFGDNSPDGGPGIGLNEAPGVVIDDNLFGPSDSFVAIILGGVGPAGESITITDNESNGAGGIGILGGVDVQVARNVIINPASGEFSGITLGSSVDVDVTRNTVENAGDGGVAVLLVDIDGPNVFVDITRNTLLGDGDEAGVLLAEFAHEGELDVHFNRIVGNDVGMVVNDGNVVDATNNWWGCNEGPEFEDCDFALVIPDSLVDVDPWLTLSASADPDSISAGGATSQITADLLTDSDGNSVVGDFPDGTQLDFETDLGTVDPPFDLTQGAVASTTLTSGEEVGTANVDSTLDNETVSTAVEFTEESAPPDCTERIDGTPQNDRLNGTEGSELIRGRGGRDKVNGLGGDDCVKGGSGPDKVVGGPGEDRARGGAGDDKVKTRDGEIDVVRCGAGDDRAVADTIDEIKGCEKSDRFA